MNAQTVNPSDPKVLGGLTPYLSVDGALKASEFYQKAFGARQVFHYPPDEQGRTMHVHLHVNGSSLMLGDFYPESGHAFEKPAACTMQQSVPPGNAQSMLDAQSRCHSRICSGATAGVR